MKQAIIRTTAATLVLLALLPLIGAADALELGDNVRGFLVCAILDELDRVVCAMGGETGTAYSPAGLGDLVTTATSESSHHRRIGADLARGRTDRQGGSGANIRGGEGSLIGTLMGVLFIKATQNGLVLIGVSSLWETVVIGGLLIVVLVLDALDRKRHA